MLCRLSFVLAGNDGFLTTVIRRPSTFIRRPRFQFAQIFIKQHERYDVLKSIYLGRKIDKRDLRVMVERKPPSSLHFISFSLSRTTIIRL